MAFTSLKTINNLDSVVRQIRKLTPLTLKQKKMICAHILSSASTVMEITKQTQKWHVKKYTKTYENRLNSIRSVVNDIPQ